MTQLHWTMVIKRGWRWYFPSKSIEEYFQKLNWIPDQLTYCSKPAEREQSSRLKVKKKVVQSKTNLLRCYAVCVKNPWIFKKLYLLRLKKVQTVLCRRAYANKHNAHPLGFTYCHPISLKKFPPASKGRVIVGASFFPWKYVKQATLTDWASFDLPASL